jgi:hypothetical protein
MRVLDNKKSNFTRIDTSDTIIGRARPRARVSVMSMKQNVITTLMVMKVPGQLVEAGNEEHTSLLC